MTLEVTFLKQIEAEPENALHRMIYADWLEEYGDPLSEYIRLECGFQKSKKQEEDRKRMFKVCVEAPDNILNWLKQRPKISGEELLLPLVSFTVEIDYSQSLDQMIEAGTYNDRNDNITAENFPITGKGEKVDEQLVLVHFNRVISSNDAIKKMEQMGLEPAKTHHPLAYSAQHWQCDPEFIVALGSSWVDPNGNRFVPCLSCYDGDRWLALSLFDNDWPDYWHFLAICKS